jgi:DNA-binding transcriptional LysR family regulator
MPRILMERSGEMEVFLRVVEKGGFSAAARSLDLTPSAVSKLIARLEDTTSGYGCWRPTRKLTLTDEGETYRRAALRVLKNLDGADQVVTTDSARGRIRINASLPFCTMVASAVFCSVIRT